MFEKLSYPSHYCQVMSPHQQTYSSWFRSWVFGKFGKLRNCVIRVYIYTTYDLYHIQYLFLSLSLYIYLKIHMYINIYIYTERERERDRCIYIHTHIHIEMGYMIYVIDTTRAWLQSSPSAEVCATNVLWAPPVEPTAAADAAFVLRKAMQMSLAWRSASHALPKAPRHVRDVKFPPEKNMGKIVVTFQEMWLSACLQEGNWI